jgi:hypothetical protein
MMAGADEAWDQLFSKLERLRAAWPDRVWSYDRRFKCVVSSVSTAHDAAVRAAIAELLTSSFTAESLAAAPEAVRALANQCGGLRPSQLLLWGGTAGAPGVFGLWWPWGDGSTLSLRIGLHDVDAPKQRYPRLRDIFGIPQPPAAPDAG